MIEFTREALYELVWAEPLTTLAPKFGVSDVALRKKLVKLGVPLPSRGYWAKRPSDRRKLQVPMPSRGFGESLSIKFDRWFGPEADPVDMPPLALSESIEAVRARAEAIVRSIALPKKLKVDHPTVARLLRADEERRRRIAESPYGWSSIRPSFEGEIGARRARLLSRIFTILAGAGIECSASRSSAEEFVIRCPNGVGFYVALGDPAEILSNIGRRSALPSKLCFAIALPERIKDVPLVWTDGQLSLEDQIQDIASGVLLALERFLRYSIDDDRERRIAKQIAMEEALEAERVAAAAAERRRLELERLSRIRKLISEARSLERAMTIRKYVSDVLALGDAEGASSEEITRWAAWARSVADDLDPVASGRFLEGFK